MTPVTRLTFAVASVILAAPAQSAGTLRWTVPPGWINEGERPMRAATYRVLPVSGDSEAGECAVFYFGPGQGGSVEANLKRWIAQFEYASQPQTKQLTINDLPVTTVDISGAYTGAGGPLATAKTAKPGYRLLGGIAEGPRGAVFFKFTGPAKTVAANQAAFQKLLNSVTR